MTRCRMLDIGCLMLASPRQSLRLLFDGIPGGRDCFFEDEEDSFLTVTLPQGTCGGAEALRPFWSRGPRPSSKTVVEGRRLSARFGRGACDSPAIQPWRGGGSPPVLVAGPATLQQYSRGGAEAFSPFWSRGPRPSSNTAVEGRRLSARFGRGACDSPAIQPWRGGGSPPVLVAGPATLQQYSRGGAEALRPFWSRGPRPSSKTAVEGRRLSVRFGRGARDSPAIQPWRGGGSPPISVAGPATLQQGKKGEAFFFG
jgi:hypothetical protein